MRRLMDNQPRAPSRIPRPLVLSIVAILLFGWVFLYRFNTLGGAYGGFDNDHFLYLAVAKQVEAGEQPLRDFQDAMHGGWPSLTYEFSAAAQRYLGDSLRSEALLTVTGVALGAAIGFVAGTAVAPWPWALVTSMLAAFLAPKLYGYPKVLVTAVAAWLIVGTRGLPTWRRTIVMAIWTAAAFLFRHDYAVYCAAGFGTILLLSGSVIWRDRLARIGGYVVVTAILLAPALWWIHQYRGIGEYVRNALEMSRAEYLRTRIGWPALSYDNVQSAIGLLSTENNAAVWIYYLFLAVPVLAVVIAARQLVRNGQRDRMIAIVALSVMTVALWYSFLRGNLGARFGEMGPPVAVLGAWLLSMTLAPASWPRLLVKGVSALAVMYLTVACIWRVGSVTGELRSSRLLEPQDVIARMKQNSVDLAAMPRSLRESEAAGRMQASDYLHRCTKPTDRVIAFGYYADVPVFSERLFAGGRASFVVAYYRDPLYTREIIGRLQSQSVPIVLAGPDLDHEEYRPVADYIRAHYDNHGQVTSSQGPLRVWTRRGLTATPSGPNGLPCFG
jgi:hypothetical protein